MRISSDKNYKIFLFAFKKYRKDDRNDILLLKLFNDKRKKFKNFMIRNLEVYFFVLS